MKNRKLKGSNKSICPLGLGTWALGGPFMTEEGKYFGYGEVNDKESIETVHRAIELGINFFDTADVYGVGHSEKILGEAVKEYRDDVIIATKFGSMFQEGNDIIPDEHTSSVEYIRNAVNDSCRRLNTDFIDLYQYHWWECPLDEGVIVRDTLDDLVTEGTIGGYGWSTHLLDQARLFVEGKHCLAMQYSLNVTTNNQEMLQLCIDNELLSVIRSPLAFGILTGKYSGGINLPEKHWLKSMKLEEGYFNKVIKFVDSVKEVITEDGRTLSQAALGYIWAINDTTVPIPGAKNLKQINENAAALEFGPLSNEMMKFIQNAFEEF